MKLRRLEQKDADRMLEWMHDENVVEYFNANFQDKTLEDVKNFISNSFNDENQNFAIVDDDDLYQGTISLKNLDLKNKNAEYAIVVRSDAMGKGISRIASDLILDYAFNELKLHKVYFCVAKDNIRAIKFYTKYGFTYEGTSVEHLKREDSFVDLEWYYILNKKEVNGND